MSLLLSIAEITVKLQHDKSVGGIRRWKQLTELFFTVRKKKNYLESRYGMRGMTK